MSSLNDQSENNPDFEGVLDVPPQAVKENADQLMIIDVRRPDEYEGELGHIKSAQLIVLDTLPERFNDIPKDETVVLICRSGRRSAQASQFLKENGYENTFNMKGGMLAWNELGFETEK
tara:strand:+ start:224 stop:580 length:357 start_codon:yes stop_codon:yes gene_type:complete